MASVRNQVPQPEDLLSLQEFVCRYPQFTVEQLYRLRKARDVDGLFLWAGRLFVRVPEFFRWAQEQAKRPSLYNKRIHGSNDMSSKGML